MFELLTNEDCEVIKNYISNYACADHYKSELIDLEYILRFWNEEKQGLFDKGFKNSLILERDVTFNSIRQNIEEEFEEQIRKNSKFSEIFYRFKNNLYYYWNSSIKDFVSLLDISTLACNKYTGKSEKLEICGKIIQVKNGCKPVKTLQKINDIAKIITPKEFEYFRNVVSQVLNSKNLRGTMCLSIHPMDFMTMSDNNYNWGSCMSWIEEGCYRQGTVEMMNSPMVVVGYFKKANGNFMDKKWRELYIVNLEQQFICNIKSYPYNHDEMSIYNVKWLQEIFFPENHFYCLDKQSCSYNNLDNKISFSIIPSTDFMYNDFHSTYRRYVSCAAKSDEYQEYEFNYSGMSECMYCGSTDIENEATLLCESCDPYYYCTYCGERVLKEDAIIFFGETYCESCMQELFTKCVYSGEYFNRDECVNIIIYDDNGFTYDDFYIGEEYVKTFMDEYAPEVECEDYDCYTIEIPLKHFKESEFNRDRCD